MVSKKNQPPVQRSKAAPRPQPQQGLWLEMAPPLGAALPGELSASAGDQALGLAPGQTQTVSAQGARRYRLGLRAQPQSVEPGAPTESVLVLRHGDDLWLSNAQVLIHLSN